MFPNFMYNLRPTGDVGLVTRQCAASPPPSHSNAHGPLPISVLLTAAESLGVYFNLRLMLYLDVY